MKLGIISAINEEVHTIHDDINFERSEIHAEREYFLGKHNDINLVLVFSRCGKVSAASTITSLIEKYKVDFIIFTGVAGAVSSDLNIGDIVVDESSYQHDMDARPIFPQFEIPLSGRSLFKSQQQDIIKAELAIKSFIKNITHYIPENTLATFNITTPTLHSGTIATGDQFIRDASQHESLKIKDKQVLAVEMEGAAVAQVCEEHNIPYILVRTISDKADHSASINFESFISEIASHYSSGIVQEFLNYLK